MRAFFLTAFIISGSSSAHADDISGKWEIQSIGGDRQVTVQQKGKKVVVHRVLWPEFEGEKYKLEHLYRGKISAGKIKGQLLVKEDELPDYEVLRSFTGSISSTAKITIDGLPMKRVGGAASAPPAPKSSGKRPAPPPGISKAPASPPPPAKNETPSTAPPPPASAPAPPPPPSAANASAANTSAANTPPANTPPANAAPANTPPANTPGHDESANLFARIMGSPGMSDLNLFTVSNRITVPSPVAELTDEGDKLFARRDYNGALRKFREAEKIASKTHVELMHRMGRCHLKLRNFREAKLMLRRALRLDPQNDTLRGDYRRAKKRA